MRRLLRIEDFTMINGLRYYHLEEYLFEDVRSRFHVDGAISAFDFFSIIIWKANRSKSRVAARLLAKCPEETSLDAVVHKLTSSLFVARDHRERLRILLEEWGLRLPIASAVLAVLWPDYFTVYDARVCSELNGYHDLADLPSFDSIWSSYQDYRASVLAIPDGISLRDKDRYLWGRSSARQLENDIEQRFMKPASSV